MPPELLMEGKLTKAADVFAFGVLLWSMFTAWRPWQGLSRTQVCLDDIDNRQSAAAVQMKAMPCQRNADSPATSVIDWVTKAMLDALAVGQFVALRS